MKILVIDSTGHLGRLVVDELARARSGRTRFPRAPIAPGPASCPAKSRWRSAS